MKIVPPTFAPKPIELSDAAKVERPANLEDLAYADIPTLAALVKAKKVSCVELAKLSLDRLKKLDAKLHMVVNLTEERALAQAAERDHELAQGKWRGLLHGSPGCEGPPRGEGPPTWGSRSTSTRSSTPMRPS
jgi:hypothetical protein